MTIRYFILIAALLLLSSICFAGQVTLTNGDRLTGSIVKSDETTLTLKTDLAGAVEINWSGIKELKSQEKLAVTTSSAPGPYSGTVGAENGSVTIHAGPGETQTVPLSEIKALRTPAEQLAYEKSLNPPLYRGWNAGLNLGYALTGGNSQTRTLSAAFTALRPTSTDKWNLYLNSVYAKNNDPAANPKVTANNITAGIRYDRNATSRLFGFVNADFQTNALQELDLRSLLGGGLGIHAIKGERTTFDLLSGANYTREDYTTFSRNLSALTFGDEFLRKFGSSTTLVQKMFIFPDMNEVGDYHATFDLGVVTKLNKWLGWQNSFSDIYVTNPPDGNKKNDIIFTTGLNISFAH